ncbi:MAG: radical SAM protein [Deltaproteobacteria bacterium]|nr:radical SAM protein [Deltaproteobacteria bacterium]
MKKRARSTKTPGVFMCTREPGCPINLSLATRLHNYVVQNKWEFRDIEAADYIIIVACSTLPEWRQSVKAAAEYFAQRYPSKQVVVTCCFAKRDAVEAPNLVYIPLEKADEFDAIFHPTVPLRRIPSGATVEDNREVKALGAGRAAATRPFNVMVAAGCLNHCAFCIGKSVFATVKSVPLDEIVSQCQEGLRQGYTNFVIGASDVGSYGHDLGCDVTDLFDALFTKAFAGRSDLIVGFKGFEPSRFIRYFDRLKATFESGRVSWLCLPVQSGSDSVLRSMNRKYKIADVIKVIKELRQVAPALRIETDLIICFPTETAADFEASMRMLEYFDHVQMLPFELHDDTKAATLKRVFTDEEAERRRRVMESLQQNQAEHERPECRSRIDISLPSPLGGQGFAVLEVPK